MLSSPSWGCRVQPWDSLLMSCPCTARRMQGREPARLYFSARQGRRLLRLVMWGHFPTPIDRAGDIDNDSTTDVVSPSLVHFVMAARR